MCLISKTLRANGTKCLSLRTREAVRQRRVAREDPSLDLLRRELLAPARTTRIVWFGLGLGRGGRSHQIMTRLLVPCLVKHVLIFFLGKSVKRGALQYLTHTLLLRQNGHRRGNSLQRHRQGRIKKRKQHNYHRSTTPSPPKSKKQAKHAKTGTINITNFQRGTYGG